MVNVIAGSEAGSGRCILEHPGFRKLGFTECAEVGYNVTTHAPFSVDEKSGIGREPHKVILEHRTQQKNGFTGCSKKKVGSTGSALRVISADVLRGARDE